MKTKFKDAAELREYERTCHRQAEAMGMALREAQEEADEAEKEWLHAQDLVARLVLPDDMREAEPEPEGEGGWIIAVHDHNQQWFVEDADNCGFLNGHAKRFASEREASDFAADHWSHAQAVVMPLAEPAEPKLEVGGRCEYVGDSPSLKGERGTVFQINDDVASVRFDRDGLVLTSTASLKPLPKEGGA